MGISAANHHNQSPANVPFGHGNYGNWGQAFDSAILGGPCPLVCGLRSSVVSLLFSDLPFAALIE